VSREADVVVARLQQLVESQLGLRVEPAIAATVLARHPADLIDQLAAEPDRVRHLAPELTIGETYFYRHAEQLAAFRDIALPQRLACTGAVRVLSAGCSTGEEPYTLAMIAAGIEGLEITGLDINAVALARAARACYAPSSLRALPIDLERRWFTRRNDEYALAPELSGTVTLRRANLADADEPPPATYDIVFCRNVLVHFAERTARAVLRQLVRSLLPGGFLFLGHSEERPERIDGLALRESHGTVYYQAVPAVQSSSFGR
jgi:chemotaxis protein methyltransferase CheR